MLESDVFRGQAGGFKLSKGGSEGAHIGKANQEVVGCFNRASGVDGDVHLRPSQLTVST